MSGAADPSTSAYFLSPAIKVNGDQLCTVARPLVPAFTRGSETASNCESGRRESNPHDRLGR
jgi:hypothetical protein